ncbi:hypothetical protein L6R50_19740 [Myxococcota bacterium]|nr:hypothetical protein [Myxococcota bacterium]
MPAPTREAGAAPAGAPVGDAASLPPLTAEDVASFCALGVEVKATSPEFGEMWLVPAYTGSGRKEITPEHLGVLHTVLREFPGARVESFESLRGAGGEPSP